MTTNNPKPPTEAELAAIKARCVAIGDPCVQSHPTSDAAALAIALFCATAAHDLPALLAAIEERDHLIWVMSQDQEAYRRGVEDGRRREREETTLWLQAQPGRADGVAYRDPGTVRALAARYLEREFLDFGPPSPLPPDRVREENVRLRAALRRIVGEAEDLGEAARIAREALGEGA